MTGIASENPPANPQTAADVGGEQHGHGGDVEVHVALPSPADAAPGDGVSAGLDESAGEGVSAGLDESASNGVADQAPDASASLPIAPLPIEVRLFGRTDVGQVREHNEDNFLIADLDKSVRIAGEGEQILKVGAGGLVLAVCDGMGGAAAGEVASQLATDVVYERMQGAAGHQVRDRLAVDLIRALEDAGMRILAEANKNRACRGMGTTATVAALVDDHLLLGQVGDSRAYVLRGDRLVQVTRDQSLVNQLIEAGQLSEEDAENFEHSNILLQALGTADTVQVDLTYVQLRRGDVLMMCSDGLSGMLRDAEIRETLLEVESPQEACRVLIADANRAGGHDNITVITAVFDGEALSEATESDRLALKYLKYALPEPAQGRRDSRELGVRRRRNDESPTIEIVGEYELDADVSIEDLLTARSKGPGDATPTSRLLMAVLVLALLAVGWFMLKK